MPVEETVRAFDALVRDGKVLHVAMSNTTGERLAESLELAAREGLAPLRVAAAALQPRRARRL